MTRSLHIIEPGGQGGVYQSVLGQVQFRAGPTRFITIIHTARDSEFEPRFDNVRYCKCMRWQRRGPAPIRKIMSLAWSLLYLLPHVVIKTFRSHIEIHGQFGAGFFGLVVWVTRLTCSSQRYVPHNVFARGGGRFQELILKSSILSCKSVVLFNHADGQFVDRPRIIYRRLKMYVPDIEDQDLVQWKEVLEESALLTVAFVGQFRNDKNPVLVLDAIYTLPYRCVVLFLGEDKGAAKSIYERATAAPANVNVFIEEGYVNLARMAGLMRSVDVVVCPYSQASQSGVAALAQQVGAVVVAANVGGLAEQADYTFEMGGDEPAALAEVLDRVASAISENSSERDL